jgi:putative intracellular protease/amidase
MQTPRILIVLTSHDTMGDTDEKTGFWLEEFTSPYYIFRDAGAVVTLASGACSGWGSSQKKRVQRE